MDKRPATLITEFLYFYNRMTKKENRLNIHRIEPFL